MSNEENIPQQKDTETENIINNEAELTEDNEKSADKIALEELQDKYIRLAAEMENLRRRTQKEVQDAHSYSISKFARDILSVADNLNRTLKALPKEDEIKENNIFQTFVQGVEMTEREMLTTLEKHGVKSINPQGEKFDPNFHQAICESPNDQLPDNTVQEVIQTGFIIGDRILRPALVMVVKNK
ncbi:nucleotide exchange factor GrpE [Bartonella sp. DGB1]|uniref:nucleotide exchange factor GrpE n=1 Tax=Bartonella sp. DGB1 TaxID=3239807 RepID=UPI0035247CC8